MGRPRDLDWAWATATGGNLSARHKLSLAAPLARLVASYPGSRLRTARGRRGTARVDLSFPDSALARDAVAEVRETLSPWVVEHSFRTWLWGKALAQAAGVRVDDELTFVASILHDLQLEHRHAGHCFAALGGAGAERFALDHDTPADRAAAIGAAVAGHITPGALEDLADPAGFVSAGALLDLTGYQLDGLDPAWVDTVHVHHPRHGIQHAVAAEWKAEGRAVPNGRARWITRYGAFPVLLRVAPYAE